MKLFTSYRNKKFWQSIMLFLLLLNSAYSQTQADVNAVSAYIAANPNSAQAQQYNSYMRNYYGSIMFEPPSIVTYEGELLQQNMNQFYLQYGPPDIAAAAAAAAALAAAEAAVAPHPLPSGATGASNLLPRLGSTVSQGVISPLPYSFASSTQSIQLLKEFHLADFGLFTVATSNAGTPAGNAALAAYYQNNYAYCANGGAFQGPVVAINAQYLYYFCMLPVQNSYLSSTNPVTYAGNLTYYAEQQGLQPWANPKLPGSGYAEQITTNAAYQNGYPLTTFIVSTCDPSLVYNTCTPTCFEVEGALYSSVTTTITVGSASQTASATLPSSYNTNFAQYYQSTPGNICNIAAGLATVSIPVIIPPGSTSTSQTITISNTFSTMIGVWTYPGLGNGSFMGAARGSIVGGRNQNTCGGTFKISNTQIGSTFYVACRGSGITTSTTPPSGQPSGISILSF